GVVLGLALAVGAAEVSPDGKLEAVPAGDSVKLFDRATGKEVRALKGHAGAATAATFSPDGKHLATGGTDAAVCLWDLATGRLLWKFRGDNAVLALSYSADAKTLTVTDRGQNKVTLDAATGKRLR